MPSPKWRSVRRSTSLRLNVGGTKHERTLFLRGGVAGAALAFLLLSVLGCLRVPFYTPSRFLRKNVAPKEAGIAGDGSSGSRDRVALFIAIGSAPANAALRNAARAGWLQWLPKDGSVQYRFFSDARPPTNDALSSDALWDALDSESDMHGDLVLQPLATGYGDKKENAYGKRAIFQVTWCRRKFSSVEYFLRVDDDSFLCLHRLIYELKSAPRQQFFWGRYWCREGRNRADENFMLFSGDVTNLLSEDTYVGKLIPFDDQVTLGWNFGFMSWILNVTIFDDQTRLDAQQGYLTNYMHEDEVGDHAALAQFCDNYIYAHHVRSPAIITATYEQTTTRLMYPIPTRTSPRETCEKKDVSFLPARHSAKLPNVKLTLPD